MGLFRYLRRKLNTQQLKDICEASSSKADQAIAEQQELKKLGKSISSKSDQAIAGQQELKTLGNSISSKSDQAIAGQRQLKEMCDLISLKSDTAAAIEKELLEKAGQTIDGVQRLKEIGDRISSKSDIAIVSQQELLKRSDQAISGQEELVQKAGEAISDLKQLIEKEDEISSKLDMSASGQEEMASKTDKLISIQQKLIDTGDVLSSTAINAVQSIQELGRKADLAASGQEYLNGIADGIAAKVGQGLEVQQQLKSLTAGTAAKVENGLKVLGQLEETDVSLSSKADQAIQSLQVLGKKADQAAAVQQQLKAAADGTSAKADKALGGQQELLKKADQALAVQQDLKKKADQTAAGLQDLAKKADQAQAGQKQLNDSCAAAQVKIDQISAWQTQCVNETEFSRMSRTLFAGFRYWEDNFYNAVKGTDIEERYDRLVSGLSDDDRTMVDSMIGRIQHLCEKGDKTCYLPDEAERIYRNRKESLRIVKLNDHCFVYRGYKLPINLFETSTFACNYGLDLIEHPEYSDGKDIIDAGAYIGDSALVFDRYFSKCRRIYAFEPDADSYALMEKTIAMNKKSNIVPVAMGLGDSNCEGELTSHGMGSNLLDRRFGQEPKKDRTIKIVRLDDYAKQNNIVAGVIKTDLEGFEMHFLRGALETIKKDRPILVLSIYHSADDFFGIKPFIEDLGLGYRFRLFKADDGMILGGTCLICIPE